NAEDEGGEARPPDHPPPVAESAGEQHDERNREAGRGERPDLRQPWIDKDGAVVRARDAVAAPPPVCGEHERKPGEPKGDERDAAERDAARNPAPPRAGA